MLVDYSDSESESEAQKTIPLSPNPPSSDTAKSTLSALLPKPKSRKQAKKDRDEPKKIVVDLSQLRSAETEEDERPVKKQRTGGGSGLSAMLPAPKRSGATKATVAVQPEVAKDETEMMKSEGLDTGTAECDNEKAKAAEHEETVKPERSSTMFVPQSVAKRPIQPTSAFKKQTSSIKKAPNASTSRAKPSLFGSGINVSNGKNSAAKYSISSSRASYEPIMVEAARPQLRPSEIQESPVVDVIDEYQDDEASGVIPQDSQLQNTNEAQDFEALVRESGLDDATMRQIYGRRGRHGNLLANISTFSVDDEYAANEARRALGETDSAKPVKSVAPGRHQLRSLLNVAQSQKEALEENFAQGKRNRKEAGSKYGW